jgi:hypothetical protein
MAKHVSCSALSSTQTPLVTQVSLSKFSLINPFLGDGQHFLLGSRFCSLLLQCGWCPLVVGPVFRMVFSYNVEMGRGTGR